MKGIHALLFCLILPFPTHAGTLEMAQWIPWSMVKEEFDASASHLDFSGVQNQLSMNLQSLTPKADSLTWKISGNVQQSDIGPSGIHISAEALAGEMILTNLNIDQIVLLEAGGNEIRVRIKASCTPIRLSLHSVDLKASAALETSGNILKPRLTDFHLNLLPGSYSINSFSCNGIGGLNTEITSRVRGLLQNPENISALLFEKIAQEIPALWEENFLNLNQALGPDVQITGMKMNDAGVFLHAQLPLKAGVNVALADLRGRVFSQTHPQLILSQQGFNALLSEKILSLVPDGYDLQKVDAFADLMKSRVKQYLVWPDLRRFAGNSPFPISIGPDYSLVTTKEKNSWRASLKSNGVLKATIGGAPIDYLNYGMILDTTFSVSVKDSVLSLKTGKANFDLVYSFGALYQMLFKPDKRISVSIFKSSLASFFSQKEASGSLPELSFQNKTWKLQNWNQDQDLITMDWEE